MLFLGLRTRARPLSLFHARALALAAGTQASRPPPSRLAKYARRTAYAAGAIGTAYLADRELYASTITRNLRTLYTCAVITIDYKLNFTPEKSGEIQNLHARVAQRLFHLFTSNGGLYIKFGQAIGANAALLPKPMQEQFSRLFDDAPQVPFPTISRVLAAEFGGHPIAGPPESGALFASFEEQAMASASIAQVHRARTHDGELVAVKIQKPAVARQMEPDLLVFKLVMHAYEWFFEIPAVFVVDFISDHLREELDFANEARNGIRTAAFIAADSALARRVYVPRVREELTTRRVLTTEWIEGVRLSNRAGVMRLMGERDSRLPAASQPTLADPSSSSSASSQELHLPNWDGTPLRGGVRAVLHTMVDLFGAQIFRWGWVHCDPHPGNFLLRPHPSHPHEPQLVLLDHGLYLYCAPHFRRQYAELWRGLIGGDLATVGRIAEEWGIGAPDVFASATLMRPIRVSPGAKKSMGEDGRAGEVERKPLTEYELSVKMKERLRSFLRDTDRTPKELVFLGRNMRMVQGNNQMFGSPVNRVKLTAFAAADSIPRSRDLPLGSRVKEYLRRAVFHAVVFASDLAFWAVRVRNWVSGSGVAKRGFEDELEAQMAQMMKKQYGVDVDPALFDA